MLDASPLKLGTGNWEPIKKGAGDISAGAKNENPWGISVSLIPLGNDQVPKNPPTNFKLLLLETSFNQRAGTHVPGPRPFPSTSVQHKLKLAILDFDPEPQSIR